MSQVDTKRWTDAQVAAGEVALVESLNAECREPWERADGYWRSAVEDILDAVEGARLGQAEHERDVLTHPDVQAAFTEEETRKGIREFENSRLGQAGEGS